MPEYHLPVNGPVGQVGYFELDAFTQGYIQALFFTNCSDPDDGDLADATFDELAPEALALIITDCTTFQTDNAADLALAYEVNGYDDELAGMDYWYTRNGHGVGFWDRGLGEVGERLSKACQYHTLDPYRGDDGRVYL